MINKIIYQGRILTATIVAVFAGIIVFSSCSKVENENSNGNTYNKKAIANHLKRSDIDALASDLTILHNYELKKLCSNSEFAKLTTSEQCLYVREQIQHDYADLHLAALRPYLIMEIDTSLMNMVYDSIGFLIETGAAPRFPTYINAEMILDSLHMLLYYIDSIFWISDSQEDFTTMCAEKIDKISNGISKIEDYFYWRIGAEISYGSFCTWAEIFSNNLNGAKGANPKWKAFKEKVKNFVSDLKPYVEADFNGALDGAGYAAIGVAGAAVMSGPLAPEVESGAIIVGAGIGTVVGSVHYNNTHN